MPPHQRCVFNYDNNITWNAQTDQANPNLIVAGMGKVRAQTIQFVDGRQGLIMSQMFNYYEEFRMTKCTIRYIPRYHSPEASQAFVAQYPWWAGPPGQTGQPQGPGYIDYARQFSSLVVENYFCETAELYLIADTNDTMVTQNNLQELYAVRGLPGAKSCKTTQETSITWTPHMFDVMLQQYTGEGQGDQSTGSVTGSSTSTNAIQMTTATTMPNPWRQTKIARAATDPSTLFLNQGEFMYGWKYYIYTPFNTVTGYSTGVGPVTVGMFRVEFEFEFRKPDWRPFVSAFGFNEEDHSREINLLRTLKGEHALLYINPGPTELTIRQQVEKRRLLEAGELPAADHFSGTKRLKDTLDDIKEQGKDTTTATSKPPPAGASQSTPGPRLFRTPLGHPGSART